MTWSDIDLELMQVNVRRSCVRNHFGDTKTEASRNFTSPEEAAELVREHNGLAFLPRHAGWRIARDGLTIRHLAEDRLHLVSGLAVRVDSKSRLVNEFVKAAGKKFGGISQRGQRRLPLSA